MDNYSCVCVSVNKNTYLEWDRKVIIEQAQSCSCSIEISDIYSQFLIGCPALKLILPRYSGHAQPALPKAIATE